MATDVEDAELRHETPPAAAASPAAAAAWELHAAFKAAKQQTSTRDVSRPKTQQKLYRAT